MELRLQANQIIPLQGLLVLLSKRRDGVQISDVLNALTDSNAETLPIKNRKMVEVKSLEMELLRFR